MISLKRFKNNIYKIAFSFTILFLLQGCDDKNKFVFEDNGIITITNNEVRFVVEKQGFCYSFKNNKDEIIAPKHAESGLQIGTFGDTLQDAKSTRLLNNTESQVNFEVITTHNIVVHVKVECLENTFKISVKPEKPGTYNITLRTGALGPAYGMGDHAAYGTGKNDLVLNNFIRDPFDVKGQGGIRMVSNFAVFPQNGLGMVNVEPKGKLVRITDSETAQGSKNVEEMPAFYYFTGDSKTIYKAFLTARNIEGYRVDKPKYDWFGVGWEAFGALGWNTNHQTVKKNVNQYLDYGYPLDWMVVGSGFWPSDVGEFDKHGAPYSSNSKSEDIKKLQATTSFGMWSKEKYPEPKQFIDYFHDKGLIFIIGLRIAFIPGGPFTDEGLQKSYFIKDENNKPILHRPGFPRVPVYLLDAQNTEAAKWYAGLCEKWSVFGVDGFKEDLFGHKGKYLRDDLIDPVNELLMDKGVYIMGRNSYLGSASDIHRYQDFNYNHPQDRGPINGLAYAFSGFPYVYPDIIGGTGLATDRWGSQPKEKLRIYMIRYAQYAALNPSMAFGYGPWNYDEEVNKLCLDAANLHDRLHPYIYSNAIRTYHTGYPYTMTPLPLAFSDDKGVYDLANTKRKSYQWLIGDALLAAPLYGSDFESATSRNIYLPKGKWVDYYSGKIYVGPTTLENFDIPLDKAPLFVGGSGFIVEEIDNKLKGRLYLSTQTETVFYAKDGETKSVIKIENPNLEDLIITDLTTNTKLPYKQVRHALQFDFIAGHNYLIN